MPLLHYSLMSLNRVEPSMPPIILIGDTNEATDTMRKRFSFLGDSVEILSGEELRSQLDLDFQRFIEKWRGQRPFGGYAKKMGATFGLNLTRSFILADADVLWRKQVYDDLLSVIADGERIVFSEDIGPAYDPELDRKMEGPKLSEIPPLNCGFIYYPRGILRNSISGPDLGLLEASCAPAHSHFEQTIIAKIAARTGGYRFSMDLIETTLKDRLSFRDQSTGAVRHYAGAKDLFWRDV